jgi:hypothetical protein
MTITEQAENDSEPKPLHDLLRFPDLKDKLKIHEAGSPESDTAA